MLKTLVASALLAATALPASAQSSNFADWSAFGDVALGVPSTTASLSTAATDSGETPLGSGSALLYADLEPAMGTLFDADTLEGSGLQTTFIAAAGTKIDVSWSLDTDETDPAFADRAYVVLNGVASFLADAAPGGGIVSGVFSNVFLDAGSVTLGFAVLDVTDVLGVSTLTLSAVTVTPIPEPATWLMMALGAAGLVARARRR